MERVQIAGVITVHNRKQKTIACLRHLFNALDTFNKGSSDHAAIQLKVFLTDDGCTDGTAEAVVEEFATRDIKILKGDGNLFWAGGMRLAWQAAVDEGTPWDYYLLLNDDTNVYDNVLYELFQADEWGFKQTNRHGLSSGITCHPKKPNEITYGGFNFVNRTKGRFVMVMPNGKPQPIDLTHANILLVHHTVTDSIGIFNKGFRHRCADWDYSMTAKRKGFLTFVTANVCGECEYDHDSGKDEIQKLRKMSLKERISYINPPTRSNHDYLLYVRRNLPLRFPIAFLVRNIRVYFPSLYYHITSFRGVYKG